MNKTLRQRALLDALKHGSVSTQEDLQRVLRKRGFKVGQATLSRDLADFLIELSIALHKHAMYPEGHPSLGPAAAGVTRRAELLLEDRSTLSLGVARPDADLR